MARCTLKDKDFQRLMFRDVFALNSYLIDATILCSKQPVQLPGWIASNSNDSVLTTPPGTSTLSKAPNSTRILSGHVLINVAAKFSHHHAEVAFSEQQIA